MRWRLLTHAGHRRPSADAAVPHARTGSIQRECRKKRSCSARLQRRRRRRPRHVRGGEDGLQRLLSLLAHALVRHVALERIGLAAVVRQLPARRAHAAQTSAWQGCPHCDRPAPAGTAAVGATGTSCSLCSLCSILSLLQRRSGRLCATFACPHCSLLLSLAVAGVKHAPVRSASRLAGVAGCRGCHSTGAPGATASPQLQLYA